MQNAEPMEKTIYFEDQKEAVSLLGSRDEYMRVFQENFDCQMVSRGDRLEILGAPEVVAAAAHVLEELQYLYRQGTTITMHEVRYGIQLEKNGKGEALHTLFSDTILVTSKGRHVRPKTLGQRVYLDAIRHNSITFGIGPAGTGKTYLAVVMAVAALRTKEVQRIILTRPAVEAGERLGFLPGDLKDKLDPYLQPLYDALGDMIPTKKLQEFISDGTIQIAPLAFMRGRTLSDAVVILDEAQNTTPAQIRMFLTRMGWNTKMIITGDMTQIDLPHEQKSGLKEALQLLSGIEGISVVEFNKKDIVRHKLVTRIVNAYEAYDKARHGEKELEFKD